MDIPKILSVLLLDNQKLLIEFTNGTEKIYDCAPLLEREIFRLLENEDFFKAVRVDTGGYGISWNDDMDLSEYELWTNGDEVVLV